MEKEAKARIKINNLLQDAGWRFFDNEKGRANIELEPNVKLTKQDIEDLGEDFEKIHNGFVDYLLLDDNNFPFVVVEAKRSTIHPLEAKEQARKYATNLRVKYIILTNGDAHYFWNLEKGNPEMITSFPSYESLKSSKALTTTVKDIENIEIDEYFVATSQEPTLVQSSEWKLGNKDELFNYCMSKGIRVLRQYQLDAIKVVRNSILEKSTRFLLEMATGTGKTLTAAGIVKMFIRSELAKRVLFLVDRLELENQAWKDLTRYLQKDGISVKIYKQDKEDWKSADILISTIQSFTSDNKYKKIFSPTDFDLIISDEAHRSLGTSNRAVFEYFIAYKLGLTATPKNYLNGVKFDEEDPREIEKRQFLDTYSIFGCTPGNPTYSYTLNDGVRDKILINPTVVDARTEITTQLLSDKGLIINTDDNDIEILVKDEDGNKTKIFTEKGYEKRFFSDATNEVFCATFINNALRDPITNEIGKSIIFCVNQQHARKVTEILNRMAEEKFGERYNSDFAVQVTSNVMDAQQMTINFANNNLLGKTTWAEDYGSSKVRVVVTVGMMTTGYDCPDLLNLGLMRPIYSATEFIQIKGRGTRKHTFKLEETKQDKATFYLFDFFAVCEYFETKFDYDKKIEMPRITSDKDISEEGEETIVNKVINTGGDTLIKLEQEEVSETGMKIDKMFYQGFAEKVKTDPKVQEMLKRKDITALEWYLKESVFDKPAEYYTVKKLEQALNLDRHLTVREVAMNILGMIDRYKTKKERIVDEFENFKLLNKEQLEPYADKNQDIFAFFEAYILSNKIRKSIKEKQYAELLNTPIKENVRIIKDIIIRDRKIFDYIRDYILENDINCESFK